MSLDILVEFLPDASVGQTSGNFNFKNIYKLGIKPMPKQITYTDLRVHSNGHSEENPLVTSVSSQYHGEYPSANGRSCFRATCGICDTTVDIYIWSFSGGGKRCPTCKALFDKGLKVYQWTEVLEKKYPHILTKNTKAS